MYRSDTWGYLVSYLRYFTHKASQEYNFVVVTEMEDIAILWSSGSPESALWSDYLVASFDKIMSQRARHHYR